MPKYLKYTLLGGGAMLGLMLLLVIVIPIAFENQIIKLFIKELNHNLATEVIIDENDIDLQLLRHFPNATIEFNNVQMRESVALSKTNFLEAGQIHLLFNSWNIARGKYVIKKLIVSDGFVSLNKDKKGSINYHFWKPSASNSTKEFSMLLEEVVFKNMAFKYTDLKASQIFEALIFDGKLDGNFSSNEFTLNSEVNLLSKQIMIENQSFLVNQSINAITQITINTQKESYIFKKADFIIGNHKFELIGDINTSEKLAINLSITGDKIELGGLILLLPFQYGQYLQGLQNKGNLTFNAAINGLYSATEMPKIEVNFALQNGTIFNPKFGDQLNEVSFVGNYSNGERRNSETSSISIKNFKAKQNKQPLMIDLIYQNFKNPFINLQIDGTFPASLLAPSMLPGKISGLSGNIDLHNLNIKGNVRDLSSGLSKNPPKGMIDFNEIACKYNGYPISISNGTMQLQNTSIVFNNFALNAGESDLLISLTLNNWIETILLPPHLESTPIAISGTLESQQLDLDNLVLIFSNKANEISDTTRHNQSIPNFLTISGQLDLKIQEFNFNKLTINSINSQLKFSPNFASVRNFTGKALEGDFNITATFRKLNSGNYIFETIGLLNSIAISQLFTQFDNFKQSTITDQNLKGKATLFIENIIVEWDKNFKLLEPEIYALATLKIENGELNNYKPLESLSKFVDIKDLKNIQFSTLQNQIEIKDRIITIPATEIKSNALNLYISGSHHFNNAIDYQIRLSLADLLVRKYTSNAKNKDNYEEQSDGGVNIYISMTGNAYKPIMQYNKKAAKDKLKENGLQKESFLDIFKNEPAEDFNKKMKKESNLLEEKENEPLEFIDWESEEKN